MTEHEFRNEMRRGVGRCVLSLDDVKARAKFKKTVLWACSRNLGFDPQCEGTRAWYLHQMIRRYGDVAPFLSVVEKALFRSWGKGDWLFEQSCELLSFLAVRDGNRRAAEAIERCWTEMVDRLSRKKLSARARSGVRQGHLDCLCAAVLNCTDGERRVDRAKALVGDIGRITRVHAHWTRLDLEDVQETLFSFCGKRRLSRLIAREWILEKEDPGQMTDVWPEVSARTVYDRIREGDSIGFAGVTDRRFLRRLLVRENRRQEAVVLANLCCRSHSGRVRAELYKLFTFPEAAELLNVDCVLHDAQSSDETLSYGALLVLEEICHPKVRELALELLAGKKELLSAIPMLARNYCREDDEQLLAALREIEPFSDGDRHGVYFSLMNLFFGKRPCSVRRARDLLAYLFEVIPCAECRLHCLWAMARHRMLTKAILEECRYDCNMDVREYVSRVKSSGKSETAE